MLQTNHCLLVVEYKSAIHKAAGAGLEEECIKLGWCNQGEAKITKAYRLPAKWVIHTVGAVWEGGEYDEYKILAQCYRNCFALTRSHNIKTIAFPAISAGSYGFPIDKAAEIAIIEAIQFLKQDTSLNKIIFVCFLEEVYQAYLSIFNQKL